MPDYTFKTYIYNGQEYYEYDADLMDRDENAKFGPKKTPALVKKEFPFPKSLLSLLYLASARVSRCLPVSRHPCGNCAAQKTLTLPIRPPAS